MKMDFMKRKKIKLKSKINANKIGNGPNHTKMEMIQIKMNNLTNDGFNCTMYIGHTFSMLLLFFNFTCGNMIRTKIVSGFLSKELSKDELTAEKITFSVYFSSNNLTLCIFKLSNFTTTISSHFFHCLDFVLIAGLVFANSVENAIQWLALVTLIDQMKLIAF